MAELLPQPIEQLLPRMLGEWERSRAVFHLKEKDFWVPPEGVDLGATFHGEHAGTGVGPAAGPQTQLAQNIVLSWLGGGRIHELKTIQDNDHLTIPRPCIDMATVGYNVEWSQELRVDQSIEEYVLAAMLVRILCAEGVAGAAGEGAHADTLYDLSVGYDLPGIQGEKVSRYLAAMKDCGRVRDALRARIPSQFKHLRDLDFPDHVGTCVTLSTFHGCPADQIEAISQHLLQSEGLHVVVKMNPTLLGYDTVRSIVQDELGYADVHPDAPSFDHDLKWDEALEMVQRLRTVAANCGRTLGVKFTNTLVVRNERGFFPPEEKVMYLSGPPLHVLAMSLAGRWRGEFGASVPISFSAGIDAKNYWRAVAADLCPVTTCSDLLKPGGYGRLRRYLDRLAKEMKAVGATDRGDWLLLAEGQGAAAVAALRDGGGCSPKERAALDGLAAALTEHDAAADGASFDGVVACGGDVALRDRVAAEAGALNTPIVADEVRVDARYGFGKNKRPPNQIDSQLAFFDCINCDKCVPVCPNDANFTLELEAGTWKGGDFVVDGDGGVREEVGESFRLETNHQIANYADFCNECGNCDIFCPEQGEPYVLKPRFFAGQQSWDESPTLDGFFLDGDALVGRIEGLTYELRVHGAVHRFGDGVVLVRVDPATREVRSASCVQGAPEGHRLPLWRYHAMRQLLEALKAPDAEHPLRLA